MEGQSSKQLFLLVHLLCANRAKYYVQVRWWFEPCPLGWVFCWPKLSNTKLKYNPNNWHIPCQKEWINITILVVKNHEYLSYSPQIIILQSTEYVPCVSTVNNFISCILFATLDFFHKFYHILEDRKDNITNTCFVEQNFFLQKTQK